MAIDPGALEIQSLLEHRDFVMRLARRLAHDDHAAQDLAQDTWLAALRRPPGPAASVRGWLARVVRNQASNAQRSEDRRAAREREAARGEVEDSAEGLRERVELQHRVVGAVLALREPYRTTVLEHYYEGLPAREIAARRGCAPGTVRAQLSRALEELRERLDREHGGDREAWSVALLRIAGGTPGAGAGFGAGIATKVGAAALLVCGAALLVRSAWLGPRSVTEEPAQELSAREPLPRLPPEGEGLANPALAGVRVPVVTRGAQADAAPAVVQESLESSSISDLLATATRIELLLRARLLTPSESFEREQAALLRLPDTGLARILPRGRFGRSDSSPVMLRGAGAHFSFVTRSNDYGYPTNLGLDGGYYQGSFYGKQRGLFLSLGDLPLVELGTSIHRPPVGLSTEDRERWDVLWMDVGTTDVGFDETILERGRELQMESSVPATAGTTYLLRTISPGQYDLLAAFTCLDQDDYGHTLAWRLLARWEVPEASPGPEAAEIPAELAEPEPWMLRLTTEELLATLAAIRARGEASLLAVPESLSREWPGEAIARILDGVRYESIVEKRGAGHYYSFATQDHDYDREPDLGLWNGRLTSGFAGCNVGFLLDLGETSLDEVGNSVVSPPRDLGPDARAAWDFLWTVERPAPDERNPHGCLSEGDLARADELGVRRGALARVGHTYLLRSIPSEHDLVAAFTPVAADEHGQFLAWRLLRSSGP